MTTNVKGAVTVDPIASVTLPTPSGLVVPPAKANLFSFLPMLFSYGPTILRVLRTGVSFTTITDLIKDQRVLSFFIDLGTSKFPGIKPELAAVAAIVTTYDSDHTRWVQGAINAILGGDPGFTPLIVDGVYGEATIAAAAALQKHFKLTTDGYVGDITGAAIRIALGQLAKH